MGEEEMGGQVHLKDAPVPGPALCDEWTCPLSGLTISCSPAVSSLRRGKNIIQDVLLSQPNQRFSPTCRARTMRVREPCSELIRDDVCGLRVGVWFPFSSAIDVIVIEQPDGSLSCTPFHVRFGRLPQLSNSERLVTLKVR